MFRMMFFSTVRAQGRSSVRIRTPFVTRVNTAAAGADSSKDIGNAARRRPLNLQIAQPHERRAAAQLA